MQDLIPYVAASLGFLAVWVLNSIKQEIRDIRVSLGALEKDLRDGVSDLDRRVTHMEAKCSNTRGCQ